MAGMPGMDMGGMKSKGVKAEMEDIKGMDRPHMKH